MSKLSGGGAGPYTGRSFAAMVDVFCSRRMAALSASSAMRVCQTLDTAISPLTSRRGVAEHTPM